MSNFSSGILHHGAARHGSTLTAKSRLGMTLAELLVVLAILAVVALTAVKALGPVAQQARFDATQRTLENIRNAVVENNADSISFSTVSGFLADNGRVPEGADPLAELYGSSLTTLQTAGLSADLIPFQTFSYAPGATVTFPSGSVTFPASSIVGSTVPYMSISCGWRGPYLRLPIGATTVTDGWGGTLTPVPGALVTTGSYGVSNTRTSLVGVGCTPPIDVTMPSTMATAWNNDLIGEIKGNLSVTSSATAPSSYPVVLLFQPQPNTTNPVDFIPFSSGTQVPGNTTTAVPISYNFSNVYVGPRVLCAAYSTVSPAAGVNYKVVGQPWYVTVKPRVSQGPSWSVTITGP